MSFLNLICQTVVTSSLFVITAAFCLRSGCFSFPVHPRLLTPSNPRLLPQLLCLGVYKGSLWGTIRPYHRKEEVLWRAQGCFWTSRYMEITAPPQSVHLRTWQMALTLQDTCTLTASNGASAPMSSWTVPWRRQSDPHGISSTDHEWRLETSTQHILLRWCLKGS